MRARLLAQRQRKLPHPALFIAQRAVEDRASPRGRQRLQHHEPRARHERRIDLEVGILRGGADENDGAVFHDRQEGILLRLVEAVNFIHEQDGALLSVLAPLARLLDDFAQFRHPGCHRAEGDEMRARMSGQQMRERGFAAAGRPPQDKRGYFIVFDRAAQRFPRPQDLFLPDELLQRARTHPRCQWRITRNRRFRRIDIEKVWHVWQLYHC